MNGTPGTTDGTKFEGGDSDALLTYATGGISPTITLLPDGNITFQVTINYLTDDLVTSIKQSSDLQTWSTSDLTPISRENLGNNLERVTYQTTTPSNEENIFLRFHIENH